MPSQPGISVVVATHNGARFLREQLDSLAAQTHAPLEVIVTDDASTDDTVKIVKDYASGSSIHFRIMENRQALGFRNNFLKGALAARGELVAFCDQDDIWDPSKLELCAAYAGDRSIALIVHTAISVDASNTKLGLFSQGIRGSGVKPPLSYDPWLTFFGFSMVFRRDLLDIWSTKDRFLDFIVPGQAIAHDRWIMFLAQIVGRTVEIDRPLVRYRQHDRNLFGDGLRKRRANRQSVFQEQTAYQTATRDMIRIVADLPASTAESFPLFDRDKALRFLHRAEQQLERRGTIYSASTRAEALRRVLSILSSGIYRAVHDDRLRWRSIAKDVRFALMRQ